MGHRERITAAARQDADEFSTENPPGILFGAGRERAIKRFLHERHQFGVYNVFPLPKPDYASWLCRLPDGCWCAAVDRNQITKWSGVTKIPVSALVVRSVLHEHGHMRYSPNTGGLDATNPPFVTPASPEEEGDAWEYAMAFIGAVLGKHACARRLEKGIDDTPCVSL